MQICVREYLKVIVKMVVQASGALANEGQRTLSKAKLTTMILIRISYYIVQVYKSSTQMILSLNRIKEFMQLTGENVR